MGDGAGGVPWTTEGLRLQSLIGQRSVGDTLELRADLFALDARYEDAARSFGAANAQYARDGQHWPRVPATPQLLDAVHAALPPSRFAELWESGERIGLTDLVGEWA